MQVATQLRLVYWSVAAAALLLAADVALAAAALRNLAELNSRMMTLQQLQLVHADYLNNLLVGAVGAITVGVLVVFVRRPSNKVRMAIWLIAPLLALTLLCGLVGGPEWAVAPTGDEPELLRQEYARAVPDWYVWLHGVVGLSAAALLFFAAGFITRTDLREHYMDPAGTGDYRSWIDRTGGR